MKRKTEENKDIRTFGKDPEIVKERRKQIANAAVKLFMKKGFHKTNTREIAEEAGLGKGTLYHYIEKKEDIFYLLSTSAFDFVNELTEEVFAEGTPESKGGKRSYKDILTKAIHGYFEYVGKYRDLTLFWYQESRNLEGASRKTLLDGHMSLNEMYRDILSKGQAAGEFGEFNPWLVAESITALADMWAFRRWTLKSEYDLESYINEQTGFLMKAILKK